MVAKELQETLREITMYGFGLILICHSKERATQEVDAEGNAIVSVEPDLGGKNIYQVCNSVCDLIAYIGVEFDDKGQAHRWLYTRQTPYIFAGSRWRYLQSKIPFGYDELVNAIGDAIQKQVELDGAVVVDHSTQLEMPIARDFSEVMNEAKTFWINYLNNVENDEEKDQHLNIMKDIIRRIFGNGEFKLSQAVPSQIDLVELFISEMKDLATK